MKEGRGKMEQRHENENIQKWGKGLLREQKVK